MADVFSNDRVDGSPEDEISGKSKQRKIDETDMLKVDLEEQPGIPAGTPQSMQKEVVVVSEKKKAVAKSPDSQRTSSAKISAEVFEKVCFLYVLYVIVH